MFSFQWQVWIHPSRQQITAILLLVASVGALLPIPYASSHPNNGKDRSRPFPCQDRPCGCRSAEQCKKKCCCFTSEQKLAWAKRNGVEASEVIAATPKCKTDAVTTRKGCCSSTRVAKSEAKGIDRLPNSTTKAKSRYQMVIGVMAQECQGIAQTLSGQFVFVIPPSISLESLIEPTGERFILEGTRFVQPFTEPPVPPPRLVAA